jgi:hypothetical protein
MFGLENQDRLDGCTAISGNDVNCVQYFLQVKMPDALVYELYGLTEEEIRIVVGA